MESLAKFDESLVLRSFSPAACSWIACSCAAVYSIVVSPTAPVVMCGASSTDRLEFALLPSHLGERQFAPPHPLVVLADEPHYQHLATTAASPLTRPLSGGQADSTSSYR